MLLEQKRYYGLGVTMTVCSWNTSVIMVWAWAPWSPYALGTRTLVVFGHGCSGHRVLSEHERSHGLGMGALVSVCSWNTNAIMVSAWVLQCRYALGTRTLLWFGHGCTNVILVWAWMLSSSSALQHECHFGLGMDATVTVCSWNTNVLRFGHGCSNDRMLLEHEPRNTNVVWFGEYVVWFGEWMLWPTYALETRTFFVVSAWVLWSPCAPGHKRYYCLGALGQKRYYGLGD